MNLVSAWFVSDLVYHYAVHLDVGQLGERGCLVVGARGRGFDTYLRRIIHIYSPKSAGNTHPGMTEKLLTGTLSINTNKQTHTQTIIINAYHINV